MDKKTRLPISFLKTQTKFNLLASTPSKNSVYALCPADVLQNCFISDQIPFIFATLASYQRTCLGFINLVIYFTSKGSYSSRYLKDLTSMYKGVDITLEV